MLPTLKRITMNSNASNDLKLLIYDFYKNPLKLIYFFKIPFLVSSYKSTIQHWKLVIWTVLEKTSGKTK